MSDSNQPNNVNSSLEFCFTHTEPDNFQIQSTAIYDYALSTNNVSILESIKKICQTVDYSKSFGSMNPLCPTDSNWDKIIQLYFWVWKNDITLMDHMIRIKNEIDNLAIAIVAVDATDYEILKKLFSVGFNPNQHIQISNPNMWTYTEHKMDFFSYVVKKGDLQLVKFMLDNSTNPLFNNGYCLIQSCLASNDVFDYLFDNFDFATTTYQKCIYRCLRDIDLSRINKLIKKEIKLNNLDSDLREQFMSRLSLSGLELFKIVEQTDFEIDAKFIDAVIRANNSALLEYLLSKEHQLNNTQIIDLLKSSDIRMLIVLTKYDTRLDNIEPISDKNSDADFITTGLENLGLDLKKLSILLIGSNLERNGWTRYESCRTPIDINDTTYI